jgi:hypothetical protein
MIATSHKIARELLRLPNRELTVSIDISTGDHDADRRVFSGEYYGINDIEHEEIVLLFGGILNDNDTLLD